MTYCVASYDCTTGAELTPPTGIKIMTRRPVEDDEDVRLRTTGKKAAASQVADPPEDAHKRIARVRVLVNHKPLAKGDVLMVFHKPEKKSEKRPLNSAPIPIAKVIRKGR